MFCTAKPFVWLAMPHTLTTLFSFRHVACTLMARRAPLPHATQDVLVKLSKSSNFQNDSNKWKVYEGRIVQNNEFGK
jgi:hypothetical protein